MSELHTVDQLELGYSKSQIYWRIEKLVENGLMDSPKRGKRNQYLLSEEDLGLLNQLKSMEEEHETVKDAIAALESGKAAGEEEEMEERVERLEKKTQNLENQLAAQEDKMKHPGRKWADKLRNGVGRVIDWFK